MAKILHIAHIVLLTLLVWCHPAGIPAVGQTRKVGPELTTFAPNVDSSIRERLIAVTLAEVGTLEIGKNNHGPGPKKYLAACRLPEGYAYCACFVKWSLLQVGIHTQGTAWSPSWSVGPEVYYRRGQSTQSVAERVEAGDVFTLYYTNLKRVGHVGFIYIPSDPRADDWAFTIEGNTNGEGSREGDGVHRRRRLKRSFYTIANFISP